MTGTACAILAMFNFCLNVAICASVGGISCGTIILYDVSNKLLGVVFIWLFNILYNILTNRIEYNAQSVQHRTQLPYDVKLDWMFSI